MQTPVSVQQESAIQLKGSLFTLTVLQIQQYDFAGVMAYLDQLIAKTPKFFHQMPVVLDVHKINRYEDRVDIDYLNRELRARNIIPVGIRGGTTGINQLALETGLAIMPTTKGESYSESVSKQSTASNNVNLNTPKTTQVIDKAVRSGQQIYNKHGDLIVLGSVSHGAEIIAAGNIHVYGALRGRALAGVNGDAKHHIFCQQLDAELISIAGTYLVKEDIPSLDGEDYKAIDIYMHNEHLKVRLL